MSIRRKYRKQSKRRSCKKQSKRNYKKQSKRRSCKKQSKDNSSKRITHEFIKSFILSYVPKIDGFKIKRRPAVKKSLFRPKRPAVQRRPSVFIEENENIDEEIEDTFVPVQATNIDVIKMVPSVLLDYTPIKVEPKEKPVSTKIMSYSEEMERREREESEKNEKYKVRRKYDEGKYYFKLIYNEPDIVYSKIKEIYEDDEYIKNLSNNSLYTPQEKEMLSFIYIYENELQNFNRDHKEAYEYFDANYTRNEFKRSYQDYYYSKKIQRIRDSMYLKDEYKPKLILIELYKKLTKKRAITIENVRNYRELARRLGKDISEKFAESTDYLKYKFQFTNFLVFEDYINYLLNKYRNNSIIKDIKNNRNNENGKIVDMLLIIYLKIIVDIPTEENVQLSIKQELDNQISNPIFIPFVNNKYREEETNYKYKIALAYFDSIYGSNNRDKNILILFNKYKEFLTGKNYKENVIILMKLYQDSLKKDNLNYNSAINFFNAKFGKNAPEKIQKLQERYRKELQDKDNYERIPIIKEIYINETKYIDILYKKAVEYYNRILKGKNIDIETYIKSKIDNYNNFIDLYKNQGYADLEGFKVIGFDKDKDVYDKVIAIMIYLSEDIDHKRELDDKYFYKKYLNNDKSKIDLLKLRYGDVNLPEDKKIIHYAGIDKLENELIEDKYKIARNFYMKTYNTDEQIKAYVNRNLNNNEILRYINLGYYPIKYKTGSINAYTFNVKSYNFDENIRDKINAFILYKQDYDKYEIGKITEAIKNKIEYEAKLQDEVEKFSDELTKEASNYFSLKYTEDELKKLLASLQKDYASELNIIYNNGITIGWRFFKFDNLLDPKNKNVRDKIKLYFLYTKEKEEVVIEKNFKTALKYFYTTYPNIPPKTLAIPGAGAGPPVEVLPEPDKITSSQLKTLFYESNSAPFRRIMQLSADYDKYIKRYWDYTYPDSRMLKYRIYCYYLYDLLTKERLTYLEQFKIIYSAGAFVIDYIISWISYIFTPANYLYDLYRNIGVKQLDKDKIRIYKILTVEEILNTNTNITLEIRDGIDRNRTELITLGDNLLAIQNQGININPQFNILIQQYITRINEVQEELNRTTIQTAGRSAVLTAQVLRRLRDNAESLDRNTREVANLVAASREGSAFTGGSQARDVRSPLTSAEPTPFATPLREDTYE